MEAAVKRRAIQSLWHFTRVDNLDSIVKNGLLPRSELEERGYPISFNDPKRLDGYKQANCISVSYPNYRLFYPLRMKTPDTKWMVISIKPDVLWLKDCAYFSTNAASALMSTKPLEAFRGTEAFERMFAEVDGIPGRRKQQLKPRDTTDPQAEVLVFDTIELDLINGIVVESPVLKQKLEKAYPDVKFLCDKAHFSPRKNYQNW